MNYSNQLLLQVLKSSFWDREDEEGPIGFDQVQNWGGGGGTLLVRCYSMFVSKLPHPPDVHKNRL